MSEVKDTNASDAAGESKQRHFDLDMTIAEAMSVHPRVREVFAAFHLGGCAHCSIGSFETVGQVCEGYGVDPEMLLEVLEGLMEEQPAE